MTPIEIAGERINEADIPDCVYFREHTSPGYEEQIQFATCPTHAVVYRGVKYMLDDNTHYWLPVIAAVARCHFLDKAKAEEYNRPQRAYLASAAKWARIAKGVGK